MKFLGSIRNPGAMRFDRLARKLRAWILIQACCAIGVTFWLESTFPVADWGMLGLLCFAGLVAGAARVDPSAGKACITLTFTVTYYTFLILGPSAAVLVSLFGVIGGVSLRHGEQGWHIQIRKSLTYQALYNLSNLILGIGAMAAVHHLLRGEFPLQVQNLNWGALAAPPMAFYVVNAIGMSVAMAWSQERQAWATFREYFAWAWPGFAASASIGAVVVCVTSWLPFQLPGIAILILAPLSYIIYYSFNVRSQKLKADMEHMGTVNRLNEAMIASLAMAIETKDPHTHKHVNRVREYAVGVATRLGITGGDLEAIRAAALLHDIGKIGIPEQILLKRGKLSASEFEIIKSHVAMGVAILEQVDFPWPVVPIVRGHHERWDGLGYPDGLCGEQIPLGARILSLVDMYDALTSDRPYRRAVRQEQALDMIRANAGTQFDPELTKIFIKSLPEMDAAIEQLAQDAPAEKPSVVEILAQRVASLQVAQLDQPLSEEEFLQELNALPIASRGAPMLSADLVDAIKPHIPFSTLVLYVVNQERRTLTPISVEGDWRELFDGLEIHLGEGMSGYVATTGRSVINVAAGMDLSRRVRPGENLELSSALAAPIVVGGKTLGVLAAYHSSYSVYRELHGDRLQLLAQFLSQSDPYALVLEAQSRAFVNDPVTGLPSCVNLLQFLHSQVTIAQTREEEFAVLVIGESATSRHTEESLRRSRTGLAAHLRDALREGDFVAHTADGDFAVVLPRCNQIDAAVISDRIVAHCRTRSHAGTQSQVVYGLAAYPADGANGKSLLEAAARRMVEMGTPRVFDLEHPPVPIPGYGPDDSPKRNLG